MSTPKKQGDGVVIKEHFLLCAFVYVTCSYLHCLGATFGPGEPSSHFTSICSTSQRRQIPLALMSACRTLRCSMSNQHQTRLMESEPYSIKPIRTPNCLFK